ncbi:MAG: hypothetical protein LPK92_00110, partial [Actinomycetes bacterium]|nr:hypothetical protein [Actinomycetes bacterium]
MSEVLKPLIGVAANRPLTRAEAEAAFNALFEGEGTPAQMGGFLMALRTRGETVDEYAAAASVMRSKCNPVKAPEGAIDIVGTAAVPSLAEDGLAVDVEETAALIRDTWLEGGPVPAVVVVVE